MKFTVVWSNLELHRLPSPKKVTSDTEGLGHMVQGHDNQILKNKPCNTKLITSFHLRGLMRPRLLKVTHVILEHLLRVAMSLNSGPA